MPNAQAPVIRGLELFEHTFGGPQNQQPQYFPLPVLIANGIVTSRWHLTAEERAAVAAGADILVSLATGGAVPPQRVVIAAMDSDPMSMAEALGIVGDYGQGDPSGEVTR